jgi:hypothetical protein
MVLSSGCSVPAGVGEGVPEGPRSEVWAATKQGKEMTITRIAASHACFHPIVCFCGFIRAACTDSYRRSPDASPVEFIPEEGASRRDISSHFWIGVASFSGQPEFVNGNSFAWRLRVSGDFLLTSLDGFPKGGYEPRFDFSDPSGSRARARRRVQGGGPHMSMSWKKIGLGVWLAVQLPGWVVGQQPGLPAMPAPAVLPGGPPELAPLFPPPGLWENPCQSPEPKCSCRPLCCDCLVDKIVNAFQTPVCALRGSPITPLCPRAAIDPAAQSLPNLPPGFHEATLQPKEASMDGALNKELQTKYQELNSNLLPSLHTPVGACTTTGKRGLFDIIGRAFDHSGTDEHR